MVIDLFYNTVRTCSDTEEETEKIVAQLLDKYQPELLIFAIKWMRKKFPYSFTSMSQLEQYMAVIQIQFDTIEVRKRLERSNAEYDPKNEFKATGPPEWFRKGIDFDLFK